jgi:wobble nucleotide-excising tRNase
MSLRKIVSIQNVGKFQNANAAGDVEFKKFTLIYGENGRGKTTICAILRSLQSGESGHVVGRQTLGATNQPAIHVLLNGANPQTRFQQGAWTQTLPNLAIYDNVFISENVYAGDEVGTDQKRNLYKVIVGRDAVQKAQRLDELVKEIRSTSAAIKDANRAVEAHLQPGLSLKALLEAQADPAIDEKITKAEADLRSVSEVEALVRHPGFATVTIPEQPSALTELLAETLESVTAAVDQQIQAHLSRHGMRSGGQAWISQGMEFKLEEGCPFCGQRLDGVALIDDYKVLFSDGYRSLKERITTTGKDIGDRFGEQFLLKLDAMIAANREVTRFWKAHAEFTPPDDALVSRAVEIATRYREAVLKLLRQKVSAPLEALALDEAAITASAEYDSLTNGLERYNSDVAAANAVFAARKAQIGTLKVADAKVRLENLKTLKRRHEPQLKALCDKAIQCAEAKLRQEAERDAIKDDLDKHSGDVVGKYQNSINRYLDLFNAGFSISKVDHNYVGGVNASYHLMINRVSIPLGDIRTPISQPSFKNTLSSGDRSTLALALFLAQLEHDAARSDRIAVFDDPFNSQDSFRRNQTAIEIARVIPNVSQVIVLSHDAKFLKDLSGKAVGVETKTLKLNPVGETTEICELDLDAMLREEVRVFIDVLQTYYAGQGGAARDVIQKIRPLLEAYCRNSCVTQFSTDDILSGILTKIRATGDTHPLHRVYNDLNDLNDYTSRYHHADGSVSGVIDEGELKGYAKRALRLVGAM